MLGGVTCRAAPDQVVLAVAESVELAVVVPAAVRPVAVTMFRWCI